MKRLIIAVILLSSTLLFSVYSYFLTNSKIDEIIEIMENDRKITISTNSPDISRTEKVQDAWKKNETFLVSILAHDELEEIEIGIMCLNNYMVQGYTEEYVKTLNECINQLYHIKETEKADIKNIF